MKKRDGFSRSFGNMWRDICLDIRAKRSKVSRASRVMRVRTAVWRLVGLDFGAGNAIGAEWSVVRDDYAGFITQRTNKGFGTMKAKNASHTLEWLLDYEVRNSSRHRRFVSLVVLAGNKERSDLVETLNGSIRESDQFFELDEGAAIVMGDTEESEALRAVDRFRSKCGDEMGLRCALSVFPQDGPSADRLLAAAFRRLKTARTLNSGALVSCG
jgi:hypothetical protein